MPKFYTAIDLNKNQLKFASLHPSATVPTGSNAAGQIYFDTNAANTSTYNRLIVRDSANASWLNIPYSGSIVAGDFASQATANRVLASPNGSSGAPTFRQIVIGDIDSTSVKLNTIAAPTGSVDFNSQSLTGVNQITTTGDVTVGGDLNITGSINETSVTNLKVKDLTITVAQGSTNKAAADNAGLTVDLGSDTAKLYYIAASDSFKFSKPLASISSNTGSVATKYSAQFQNTTGSNAITHNLGTSYVTVQIYESSTPNAGGGVPTNLVFADIAITSANQVTVTLPSDSLYYFVVVTG